MSDETLRDVLPKEALGFPDDPFYEYLDVRVIEKRSGGWSGPQKNVHFWWRLENGKAVGWNESPSHGWSWPVIADPKRDAYFVVDPDDSGVRCYVVVSRHRSESAAKSAASGRRQAFRCSHRDRPDKGAYISVSHLNRIGTELDSSHEKN